MKDRPILFSAPMVRSILAGTKTQTRRLYKPRHADPYEGVEDGEPWRCDEYGDYHAVPCPHGAPGDRLWVKETWCSGDRWASLNGSNADNDPSQTIRYRADNGARTFRSPVAGDWFTPNMYAWSDPDKWKSPLSMSRWMSRLTLGITAVRFQRLQDISEEDARAEGAIHAIDEEWSVLPEPKRPAHGCVACSGDPRGIPELCHNSVRGKGRPWACHYALLWDSINGDGSWATNPWVWAITFERIP